MRYDRAFEEAIREGYLTVRQAIARGNRSAHAAELQRHHGLPESLALRVTDNRTTLTAALAEMHEPVAPRPAERAGLRPALSAAVLAALVFVLVGAGYRQHQHEIVRGLESRAGAPSVKDAVSGQGEATAAAHAVEIEGQASVERGTNGLATRVSAGHPVEALRAFCGTATIGVTCSALEVRPLAPRSPGRRLGWFELDGGERTNWEVLLRRDSRTGRWSIGTGLRPIVPAYRRARATDAPRAWPFAPAFELVDTEQPAPGAG